MQNVVVGEYRSQDPPKNFAVRVRLKNVTSRNLILSANQQPIPLAVVTGVQEGSDGAIEMATQNQDKAEEEEIVVHWQEKLFSEREFQFYESGLNCLSALDEKYHNDVMAMSSQGGRKNRRLFTYVDADRHANSLVEERDAVTLTPSEHPSYLAEKLLRMRLSNLHRRKPIGTGQNSGKIVNETPSKAFQDAHVVTTASKVMKIMADLSPNDRIGNLEDEYILCVIRFDANGQITVKPDFTKDQRPPRIETYLGEKAVFEYTIEDYSDRMTEMEESQERKLMNELYTKHAEMVSSQTGSIFHPTPSYGELFVHVFGEIVCAKGFVYDDIFVQYVLDLPSGWVNCGGSLHGNTIRCVANKNGYCHFSQPFEFHLKYQSEEDSEESFLAWPSLFFEVSSLDYWQRHRIEGYTYCSIPDCAGSTTQTLMSWRPKGNSVVSEMRRFFTGGAPELEDIGYVKVPTGHEDTVLSKASFRTELSGSIVVRLNTLLHYSDDGAVSSSSGTTRKVKRKGIASSAFDTLTHALDAFQRARRKMHAAKSALVSVS